MEIGQILPYYMNGIGGNNNLLFEADSQFSSVLMQKAMESGNVAANSKQGLEQKYGKITYNVGDISTFSNWDRNDFPVADLFKENINVDALAKWAPRNKNVAATGFEDSVQRSLKSIVDGSRSVMIHPEVQTKMNHDPEYAKEIYQKIDTYFQKDIMINESLLPGCTQGIIQFVSIDSNGNIDKTCSITDSVDRPKSGNNIPGASATNKVDSSLINEIKSTYGEKYFQSDNYTMVNSNNYNADGYIMWGTLYSEALKKKLLEI